MERSALFVAPLPVPSSFAPRPIAIPELAQPPIEVSSPIAKECSAPLVILEPIEKEFTLLVLIS